MEIGEAVRRMGLARTHRDRYWNRAVKVTDDTVQKAEPAWLEALLRALLRIPEAKLFRVDRPLASEGFGRPSCASFRRTAPVPR
ncbi:hypothetical protein ABTW95_08685 [Spirillospora sp. NPDC127506]